MISNFSLIKSLSEINSFRRRLRKDYESVVTNYTVFPSDTQKNIDNKSLYYHEQNNIVFLINEGERVREIYFFADSFKTVADNIKRIDTHSHKESVLEIVHKGKNSPIDIEPYMTLNRMSSSSIPMPDSSSKHTPILAVPENINQIETILLNNFDSAAERIPTMDELNQLTSDPKKGGIYVVKNESNIDGLMIYSRDPSTIHLRYWWTNPDKRGDGVGGSLLNEFFRQAQECQRMILWVDKNNDNAIKRYKHYGFESESMFDFIYLLNTL